MRRVGGLAPTASRSTRRRWRAWASPVASAAAGICPTSPAPVRSSGWRFSRPWAVFRPLTLDRPDQRVDIHEATVAGLGFAWRVRSCGAASNVTRSGSVAWVAILAAVRGVPAADARSTGPAGRHPRRWRWPASRTGRSRSTTMEVAGRAIACRGRSCGSVSILTRPGSMAWGAILAAVASPWVPRHRGRRTDGPTDRRTDGPTDRPTEPADGPYRRTGRIDGRAGRSLGRPQLRVRVDRHPGRFGRLGCDPRGRARCSGR